MSSLLGGFTSIFFNRDSVVVEMISKKGVLRLSARISKVFCVTGKKVAMLAAIWGDILVADCL
jgi:hypothetical protein